LEWSWVQLSHESVKIEQPLKRSRRKNGCGVQSKVVGKGLAIHMNNVFYVIEFGIKKPHNEYKSILLGVQ